MAFYGNAEDQSLANESVRKAVPVPASYPPGNRVANLSLIERQPGEGFVNYCSWNLGGLN